MGYYKALNKLLVKIDFAIKSDFNNKLKHQSLILKDHSLIKYLIYSD